MQMAFSMKKGFTVVELLVASAIIGLLVSISFPNFSAIRMQSRDRTRTTDILQIRLAIERYFDDYGVYPSGSGCFIGGQYIHCTNAGVYGDLSTLAISPYYLKIVPLDPSNPGKTGNSYGYYYARGMRKISDNSYCPSPVSSATQEYILATRFEKSGLSPIRYISSTSCTGGYTSGGWGNSSLNYVVGSSDTQ